MKICDLSINGLENYLGYKTDQIRISWKVKEVESDIVSALLRVYENRSLFREIDISDDFTDFFYCADLNYQADKDYDFQICAYDEKKNETVSESVAFRCVPDDCFAHAEWMNVQKGIDSAVFNMNVSVSKKVERAVLYCCGLGIYEAYLNEMKISDEYLLPGYHSYDLLQEYQCFDLTDDLKSGNNHFSFLLLNGWYKGRFVFGKGYENIYGDSLKLICEIRITYEDKTEEIFVSDEKWNCCSSSIGSNSIYDGETIDDSLAGKTVEYSCGGDKKLLKPRFNPPIRAVERIRPKRLIRNDSGELILDFEEMITGFVCFQNTSEKGKKLKLEYSEWLNGTSFANENLRTAKAEFVYVSNGMKEFVRPHGTYYGFRYVRISGFDDPVPEDFIAYRIQSDISRTGFIRTNDDRINRLIENVYSSQRGNFLDIPTDCPQRDERMGWTGDICVFADTACFNMDSYAFLISYLRQMRLEQIKNNGAVPLFVPRPKIFQHANEENNPLAYFPGSVAVWGDAAAVLPWTVYEHYGDIKVLREFFPMMYDWIGFVKSRCNQDGLWLDDMQLGDWLALDSIDPNGLFGLTDSGFVACAYYYRSLRICQKACKQLNYSDSEKEIRELADQVFNSFNKHFYPSGKLTITPTQTAYALLLSFDLCPKEYLDSAADALNQLIYDNGIHLSTGFAGTPFLCSALSKCGYHDTAILLLKQESYPSWLYEVNMGALSIWERWNSIDENGRFSSTGMNSLNHYAYGSVLSWFYRYVCGYQPCIEQKNTLILSPIKSSINFDSSYETPWGEYKVSHNDGIYRFEIPYASYGIIDINGKREICGQGIYTG
ncbi:MAG: family 78 glycoside hydrolase catalytic domain [Erysipelotrichaceae bacterium]|nr:family 78 glycoside hydrolase catalytic domain [Erysipelotrichaceae bacterium]